MKKLLLVSVITMLLGVLASPVAIAATAPIQRNKDSNLAVVYVGVRHPHRYYRGYYYNYAPYYRSYYYYTPYRYYYDPYYYGGGVYFGW